MSAGRVRVACTACATSKTRCDGERPCGRCVQRDMAAYCIDRPVHSMRPRERFRLPPGIACTPCKKSKVACAAVRPCPRCCQRFGDAAVVRCVDAPVVAAAPATEDPRRNLWPEKSSPLAMYRPVPKAISDALRDWCLQMDPRAIRRFLLSTPLEPELTVFMPHDEARQLIAILNDMAETSTLEPESEDCFDMDMLSHYSNDIRFDSDMRLSSKATRATFNQSALKLFGYDEAELDRYLSGSGEPPDEGPLIMPAFWRLYAPSDWLPMIERYVRTLFQRWSSFYWKASIIRRDGKAIPCINETTVSISPDGNTVSYFLSIRPMDTTFIPTDVHPTIEIQ
ncbi:unnamed protein product (mitochondrion) [Plasmodiophora brassicae]|uniref:Zn(2)-C6 fungal-type domain-containing protein n=1 Tax=Plasmodiophora brassicae TaxID=37360 RepID=A0A3P3Y078_PLABS|nr:unnamed protein product [Plasmodiophora brassicae]